MPRCPNQRRVLGGVLPFAVWKVRGIHDDARAVFLGVLSVGLRVLHPHHVRVGNLPPARRMAIIAYVADDHRSLSEAELSAVVLTDSDALD